MDATIAAKRNGHAGIFTVPMLALLAQEPVTGAFRSFLSRQKPGATIERVAQGLYINRLAPPEAPNILEKVACLLHSNFFFYASLESELSRLGVISQVTMNYLSLMTTGRSGRHTTKYGVIEFTHTKRSIQSLDAGVYYDLDAGIFRATEKQATTDLMRVGRNVEILNKGGPEENDE